MKGVYEMYCYCNNYNDFYPYYNQMPLYMNAPVCVDSAQSGNPSSHPFMVPTSGDYTIQISLPVTTGITFQIFEAGSTQAINNTTYSNGMTVYLEEGKPYTIGNPIYGAMGGFTICFNFAS